MNHELPKQRFFTGLCTRPPLLTCGSSAPDRGRRRRLPPSHHRAGCVGHLRCFGSNQQSFIRETERVRDVRTSDLAKRPEKFQHRIYKNHFKICTESIHFLQGAEAGARGPQSVAAVRPLSLSPPSLSQVWRRVGVGLLHPRSGPALLTEPRCPSGCGKGASPSSLRTEE